MTKFRDEEQRQAYLNMMRHKEENKSSAMGITGFILSLFGLFLGWLPIFGILIWLSGFVLSMIGYHKSHKGFSIAGIAISLFGLAIVVIFYVIFKFSK